MVVTDPLLRAYVAGKLDSMLFQVSCLAFQIVELVLDQIIEFGTVHQRDECTQFLF
jgi:hypothetical protein